MERKEITAWGMNTWTKDDDEWVFESLGIKEEEEESEDDE